MRDCGGIQKDENLGLNTSIKDIQISDNEFITPQFYERILRHRL